MRSHFPLWLALGKFNTMLRLWNHFPRRFVGSVGCWQLQSPLSHQGTGRKGAWKIDGQAINGISEFSEKFSRNGEKMLCFHVLVGRLAVVIPCRLMTISFPRSLALSDSISMFKTFSNRTCIKIRKNIPEGRTPPAR